MYQPLSHLRPTTPGNARRYIRFAHKASLWRWRISLTLKSTPGNARRYIRFAHEASLWRSLEMAGWPLSGVTLEWKLRRAEAHTWKFRGRYVEVTWGVLAQKVTEGVVCPQVATKGFGGRGPL